MMMKIILLKDIKNTARQGDILEVADGYARNYLFPKELASLATPEAIKKVESLGNRLKAQAETTKKEALHAANKLQEKTLVLALPADKKGNLYAGLKESEILARIRKSAAEPLPQAKLVDYSPIKIVGEHQIRVQLGSTAIIKVVLKVNPLRNSSRVNKN